MVAKGEYFKYYLNLFIKNDYRTLKDLNDYSKSFIESFDIPFEYDSKVANIVSLMDGANWESSVPNEVRKFALTIHMCAHQVGSNPEKTLAQQGSFVVKSNSIVDLMAYYCDFELTEFDKEFVLLLFKHSTNALIKGPLGLKHFSILLEAYRPQPDHEDICLLTDYYGQLLGHMVVLSFVLKSFGIADPSENIELKAIQYIYRTAMENKPPSINISLRKFSSKLIKSFNTTLSYKAGEPQCFSDNQHLQMIEIAKSHSVIWPYFGEGMELSFYATPSPNLKLDDIDNINYIKDFPAYCDAFALIYSDKPCFVSKSLEFFDVKIN